MSKFTVQAIKRTQDFEARCDDVVLVLKASGLPGHLAKATRGVYAKETAEAVARTLSKGLVPLPVQSPSAKLVVKKAESIQASS